MPLDIFEYDGLFKADLHTQQCFFSHLFVYFSTFLIEIAFIFAFYKMAFPIFDQILPIFDWFSKRNAIPIYFATFQTIPFSIISINVWGNRLKCRFPKTYLISSHLCLVCLFLEKKIVGAALEASHTSAAAHLRGCTFPHASLPAPALRGVFPGGQQAAGLLLCARWVLRGAGSMHTCFQKASARMLNLNLKRKSC